MKVLFIGGTGIISSACSRLAIERGIDLYLLNRGQGMRPVPQGANVIKGDIRNRQATGKALDGHTFDAVVDWIAFTPEHIETDIALFKDKTKQHIFISSASAYHTPPLSMPVTESTPLFNPYWQYSRDKIACEEMLMHAYRRDSFPVTIVRPSHTYDKTLLPMDGGYTVVNRMRQGKKVVVHGDGTSLWTLTHHRDFAKGLVGLLANNRAIGEVFQITSDELLTWNQIFELVADAAGTKANIVHVPSEVIASYDPEWGAGLLGDKAHSMIFDNSKIKRFVPDYAATIPFSHGVKEILAWYDSDPVHRVVDEKMDATMDTILAAAERMWAQNV